MELTPSQSRALDALIPFAVGLTTHETAALQGWSGSGKSFLTGLIVNRAQKAGLRVGVAAPTNKAVRVLREKIQAAGAVLEKEPTALGQISSRQGVVAYGSIHSFLGLRMVEHEDGSQSCQPAGEPAIQQFDFVAIDEASMIGPALYNPINDYRGNTKILYIGDPAQLPPIEGKEEISRTFTEADLKLSLTEIVRQAEGDPIIHLSAMVRQAERRVQETHLLRSLEEVVNTSVTMLCGDSRDIIAAAIQAHLADIDARILAYTNAAVVYYNQQVHAQLYPGPKPFGLGEHWLAHQQFEAANLDTGETEVVITNEEGTVALCEEDQHPNYPEIPSWRLYLDLSDGRRVTCLIPADPAPVEQRIAEQFGAWRRLKESGSHQAAKQASREAWALRKAFAPVRHGHAMTVHKSQGSTFDEAILDFSNLDRMRSTFSFNKGLYVAMTRPRHSLKIIYG